MREMRKQCAEETARRQEIVQEERRYGSVVASSRHAAASALAAAMHRALTSSNACPLALIAAASSWSAGCRQSSRSSRYATTPAARRRLPDALLRPQLWRYAARSMITARPLTAIVTPSTSCIGPAGQPARAAHHGPHAAVCPLHCDRRRHSAPQIPSSPRSAHSCYGEHGNGR